MGEDRGRAGVEHLQAAARELIAASRAFLDAVEEVVDRPEAAASVFSVFESVAKGFSRAAPWTRAGSGGGDHDEDGDGDFEHIRVD
ncbi:MAG: hypothetical protein ACRD29_25145 [Acidimicrobiales bacterium]